MSIPMSTILESAQITSMYKNKVKSVKKTREHIDMVIPKFTNAMLSKYQNDVLSYALDNSELDMTLSKQESVDNIRMLFDDTCKNLLGDRHDELSAYVFSFNAINTDEISSLSIIKHK